MDRIALLRLEDFCSIVRTSPIFGCDLTRATPGKQDKIVHFFVLTGFDPAGRCTEWAVYCGEHFAGDQANFKACKARSLAVGAWVQDFMAQRSYQLIPGYLSDSLVAGIVPPELQQALSAPKADSSPSDDGSKVTPIRGH